MKLKINYLFFFIILGVIFVDIGNPDAIRQGTEGFYLLITQEMFEANDLLTPRVYGDFHWSKPPFQFWLPMPFYYLFKENFLLWGRVSVLIFSILCCFLISFWYEREFKRNWHEAFGLLLCPLYFIKYSRIFMMEMALTYLTTLSALYFYSFFKSAHHKDFIAGSLMGALSVLVKGPVSLVMLTPPILGLTFYKKPIQIKKAFFFLALTTMFGSIWFLLSYIRFGDDFFHYFFIRENLGKFNAKNYPISSVIQGLFIYSFPVFILLWPIFRNLKKVQLKCKINVFLILCFCFFYFLWFLPKQKSHHYAVPAIPILILWISYNFNEHLKELRPKFLKIFVGIGNTIFAIGFFILSLIYYFKDSLALNNARFYLMGAGFCLALWSHLLKSKDHPLRYLKFIIPFIFLWQFLLPLGILPTVPSKVASFISGDTKLFVSYRKPFFIGEALNKEIEILKDDNPSSSVLKSGDFIFVGRPHVAKRLNEDFTILHQWKVWKRGTKIPQIMQAIKVRDITVLQDKFLLVKKK